MDEGKYSYKISYKELDKESNEIAIDFEELIKSMTFFNKSILRISENVHPPDFRKNMKVLVHPFKQGSFVTDFSLTVANPQNLPFVAGLLTFVPYASYCKEIFEVLKLWIDVKLALKGESIKSIQPSGNGNVVINGSNNSNITININQKLISALQDKTLDNNFAEGQDILNRTSNVGSIEFSAQDIETFSISKEQSKYFSKNETINKSELTLSGIVSKIDKKVKSGYFELNGERIPFKFDKIKQEKVSSLYLSLTRDTEIKISCLAEIDFYGSIKNLIIKDVIDEPVSLFK